MPITRLSRSEQQAQTRDELLNAAEAVFAKQGYGGASMELVAAEAGYSKGAIYSNFTSKEALFLALLERFMARDMAALREISALQPKALLKALSNWLKSLHTDANGPFLAIELQLHTHRSPEFAEAYDALFEQQSKGLAQILTLYFKASGKKIPLRAIDLARALTAMANGLTIQRPQSGTKGHSEAGRIVLAILTTLIESSPPDEAS